VDNSAAFALEALHDVFAAANTRIEKGGGASASASSGDTAQAVMLDVGCGPGTITVGFGEKLAALGGRVIGLDYSAEVLEGARQLAAERGMTNHVSFEQGDVYKLRWPDATFTAAHAHQVLMHLPDPVAALKEIKRVLKPSGSVLALREADLSSMAFFPLSDGLKEWMELWCRVSRAVGGEPDSGRRLLHYGLAAGFRQEQLTFSTDTLCVGDPEQCASWGEASAEMTAGKESSWARAALQGGHATQQQLDRIADAWRHWGKQPDATLIAPHGQLIVRL
jgi:SAM-dependent methyltransferase